MERGLAVPVGQINVRSLLDESLDDVDLQTDNVSLTEREAPAAHHVETGGQHQGTVTINLISKIDVAFLLQQQLQNKCQ